MAKNRTFRAPRGTRDLYPEDMLKRRYLLKAWRDTSIRHGFEEVDGPTFETLDLYRAKSGDQLVGEAFAVSRLTSGDDEEAGAADSGDAELALRPEFTPTLARLYAARAKQLAQPTKWFMIGPFFRAERPQRGRLREFLQWNCDIMGLDSDGSTESVDAEMLSISIAISESLGLTPDTVSVRFSDRRYIAHHLQRCGVAEPDLVAALTLLDRREKVAADRFMSEARLLALDVDRFDGLVRGGADVEGMLGANSRAFADRLDDHCGGRSEWRRWDASIVRGLAYYTGTVFEVIAEGERAVAGGGRYDNLIELLGGPPTPAVGFAMGDVVIGLLLEDKGLMPVGPALLEALSAPTASLRPEAFVVSLDESRDQDARRLVAELRRGVESESWLAGEGRKPWDRDRYAVAPMHARRTYKTTRKVPKLIADAEGQHAKTLVMLEAHGSATVKDLDRREQVDGVELGSVAGVVVKMLGLDRSA